MQIDKFYLDLFLKRHAGDPFAALTEACERLARVTPGISWGMIRAPAWTPPAKPPKDPPPDPLDVEPPDAD